MEEFYADAQYDISLERLRLRLNEVMRGEKVVARTESMLLLMTSRRSGASSTGTEDRRCL
jgi:hypothetical protein